jgi:hypothetical protein
VIQQLLREARAEAVGVHSPPETITCAEHGQVTATSYVKTCPDELSCGCRFVPDDGVRCPDCGWPRYPPETWAIEPDAGFCGDGQHGCLGA